MAQIAFIVGNHILYWKNIILALALLASICIFFAFYWGIGGKWDSGLAAVSLSVILAPLLSRLVHWYCFSENYPSLLSALSDYSTGGFALIGCFLGCVLAAFLLHWTPLNNDLPQMLDCMSLAGCAGIALGRLSSFFDTSNRGQIINSLRAIPWVYPVTNTVSGDKEYRLATFLLQAIIAAILFLVLTCYYFKTRRRHKYGDITLLFLLFYCASQILLDSTRYDSMYFPFNRFISVVQVSAAAVLVGILIYLSVQHVKKRGFHAWYIAIWLLLAGCVGCAGYMEYYVQRHGNQALFAYCIMGLCLLVTCAAAVCIRWLTIRHTPRYQKKTMRPHK